MMKIIQNNISKLTKFAFYNYCLYIFTILCLSIVGGQWVLATVNDEWWLFIVFIIVICFLIFLLIYLYEFQKNKLKDYLQIRPKIAILFLISNLVLFLTNITTLFSIISLFAYKYNLFDLLNEGSGGMLSGLGYLLLIIMVSWIILGVSLIHFIFIFVLKILDQKSNGLNK